MIVPMKKVSVIVQSKDSDSAIQSLRSLGLLHVEHQQPPHGEDISRLREDIVLINEAIGILLGNEFFSGAKLVNKELKDWRFRAKHIIDMKKRLNQLEEYSLTLANRISQWERWGDFDPDMIRLLEEKNVYLKLYEVAVKETNNFPKEAIVRNVFSSAGIAYCVVISREKIEAPFKEIVLPKMGLEKMRSRLHEDRRVKELITKEILQSAPYRESLLNIKKSLEKELEFHEALKGMGTSGSLMYLSGYIPYDAAQKLMDVSKKESWGIIVGDPSPEDMVPTLIRNPRWVSWINPVFKIIEVVPGYREFDISLWFLIFLSVFFGILIGDAGYGFIYFGLAFWLRCKFGEKLKDKSVFYLSYSLSAAAIIWGISTASFFGQGWLLERGIRPLVPALTDDKTVRSLCFLIGAVHLSIAHIWRIMVQFPAWVFLTDVGWILILWSAFFLARLLILGAAFPSFGFWLLFAGMALVALFSNPRKNVLLGIGAGLGTLALNLMNNFTDIVSYIRLFAVGLAGVALADAFNAMASGVGLGGWLGFFVRALILMAGHGLNLILGPMSVLVHGVRLNVLEFSTHLDVKWSGFSYHPLKESTT